MDPVRVQECNSCARFLFPLLVPAKSMTGEKALVWHTVLKVLIPEQAGALPLGFGVEESSLSRKST